MRRATVDRIDHAVTAGAVLAAHFVLVWMAAQVPTYRTDRTALVAPEPVIATLIERPRNLAIGLTPVHVSITTSCACSASRRRSRIFPSTSLCPR